MNNDNKILMTPDFLMFHKMKGAKENMKARNRPTWGQ